MSTSQPAPPTAPQNAPAAQDPPPFEAVPPPRSAVADREKLSPKSIGVVVVAAAAVMVAGIIANGVVLMNVNTYAQQAITGAVILIAVSLDVWRSRARGD